MSNATDAARRPFRLEIQRNARQRMSGYQLLRSLESKAAAAVFLDPQYRSVLDKQRYGNEGESRERARAGLAPMSERTIATWVEEVERVLRPSGHLFLWVDKFIIGEGRHKAFLAYAPLLSVVDLICWNKMRPGMGRRARCRSEYVVVVQKFPCLAKTVWTDHGIDDCWPEQSDRSLHPHAKPHLLTERLIRAVTKRGDLVVDPAAGSYGVLEACKLAGRTFVGCDLA